MGAERLAGRRILVVGGGQQDYGILDPPFGNGRAMSVMFAREGAAVAVSDVDEASAEATAELVRGEGAQAVAIAADAADEDAVSRTFAEATSGLGGLDGIVLNTGVAGGLGLEGTTVEDWDRVMAVNARAHFLGLKHGLPALRAGGGGSVVLTGSLASRETMPSPAYAASKS
ncbi:MAG: SDR family NAD(P)-dependent oxidoreductase, partial [Gaiellaceae bacterium]